MAARRARTGPGSLRPVRDLEGGHRRRRRDRPRGSRGEERGHPDRRRRRPRRPGPRPHPRPRPVQGLSTQGEETPRLARPRGDRGDRAVGRRPRRGPRHEVARRRDRAHPGPAREGHLSLNAAGLALPGRALPGYNARVEPTATQTPYRPSELPTDRVRIVSTPGACGGRPRIDGHRATIEDVAIRHERMGMSPDEIVSAYQSLARSDVRAALAYD